jgi:hypothetical protein
MQVIRFGNISAMNLKAGTVDVKFPDRVAIGIWLLDSTRFDTLEVDAPVVCAFPTGSGEGVCLGRYYNETYPPHKELELDMNVTITGTLTVNKDISSSADIRAGGNISAAGSISAGGRVSGSNIY